MSALRSSFVVGIALALSLGRPLEAASGVRALNSLDRGTVERVRARAAARLDDAECGKVLADFTDGQGRTLEANLQTLGVSASEYLLQIAFLDGSHLPACRKATVAMAVTPGVPRVFVCTGGPAQLTSLISRTESNSRLLAEAMVIHEMLHTLGLGENPPTTFEITARVRARCR